MPDSINHHDATRNPPGTATPSTSASHTSPADPAQAQSTLDQAFSTLPPAPYATILLADQAARTGASTYNRPSEAIKLQSVVLKDEIPVAEMLEHIQFARGILVAAEGRDCGIASKVSIGEVEMETYLAYTAVLTENVRMQLLEDKRVEYIQPVEHCEWGCAKTEHES